MRQALNKRDLLRYAENAVDRRAPISAELAALISASPEAQAEVTAMQRTLAFVDTVPELEPRTGSTQKILQAARRERATQRRRQRVSTLGLAVRVAATVVVVAAGALFVFALALLDAPGATMSVPMPSAAAQVNLRVQAAAAAGEAARRPEQEIKTLSALVEARNPGSPRSIFEEQRQRFVRATDMDIRAGQYALERNPGCVRAREMVNASLRRQADTLRDLYLQQTL